MKEYQDRYNKPLINPGITVEEYESNGIKQCDGCGKILDIGHDHKDICLGCVDEFRHSWR